MSEQFLKQANTAIYDYFILHLQTCMMPFFLTDHIDIGNKKNTAIYYLQNIEKNYAIYILEKNAEYLATPSNKEQVYRAFSFLAKSVNIKNKNENINNTNQDDWVINIPQNNNNNTPYNENLNEKYNKEKLVTNIPDPRLENKNFNNKKCIKR
jgi:hypothetical protein